MGNQSVPQMPTAPVPAAPQPTMVEKGGANTSARTSARKSDPSAGEVPEASDICIPPAPPRRGLSPVDTARSPTPAEGPDDQRRLGTPTECGKAPTGRVGSCRDLTGAVPSSPAHLESLVRSLPTRAVVNRLPTASTLFLWRASEARSGLRARRCRRMIPGQQSVGSQPSANAPK